MWPNLLYGTALELYVLYCTVFMHCSPVLMYSKLLMYCFHVSKLYCTVLYYMYCLPVLKFSKPLLYYTELYVLYCLPVLMYSITWDTPSMSWSSIGGTQGLLSSFRIDRELRKSNLDTVITRKIWNRKATFTPKL